MNKTPILKLNNSDDVVIARTELPAGSWLESESMETRDLIPAGHKIALRDIPAGSAVKRYGQIIGFATRDIRQGEHIHVHNLGMGSFERDYAGDRQSSSGKGCSSGYLYGDPQKRRTGGNP